MTIGDILFLRDLEGGWLWSAWLFARVSAVVRSSIWQKCLANKSDGKQKISGL